MAETTTPRYLEAVGRRKTSVARVRLTPAPKESVTINGTSLAEYFPVETLQGVVREIFTKKNLGQPFDVSVKVTGGGIASQAEAIRHGVARALLKHDPELRLDLKKSGYLTRDPRMKERRKFGLKKARKAPQWSKR
ncbi:30S ribosomal protein S9 [Patescibacteria group bacterium]|jgi:small subunit ribosomal protein S9|nr:30S ribosomal protein S9 [Patescibacteria group bacterium]